MMTIKTFSLAFMTILFSIQVNGCSLKESIRGDGNVVKETREISSFNSIKASSGVNVYLFQGDDEKVVVETDENLQDCIITKIENNTLKCYVDCNIRNSTKLNVYVNFVKLKGIKASSGADVYGETLISSDNLEVDASSAADIKIKVECESVECDASSGADIVIEGSADRFDGDASSGADIKAGKLIAKVAHAEASSGADVKIKAIDEISAKASSGGDITYYGNPKVSKISESSGGDVNHR